MIPPLPPLKVTLLEKAAADNGFDVPLPRDGTWLGFASTHAPLKLWLSVVGDTVYLAAFSQKKVAVALGDLGTPWLSPLPAGAQAGCSATDATGLHRIVRRAFQLSRTLPDEILDRFRKQTKALPKTTETERLVIQRVGQDLFRGGLLDFWDGRCAITGLAVPELLRASHIKPWADCATDAERLDVFNGLLLAPHLDAAFDRGFITVGDDGVVVVADDLDPQAREVLGLSLPLKVRSLMEGHRAYLPWHREKVFKGCGGQA